MTMERRKGVIFKMNNDRMKNDYSNGRHEFEIGN